VTPRVSWRGVICFGRYFELIVNPYVSMVLTAPGWEAGLDAEDPEVTRRERRTQFAIVLRVRDHGEVVGCDGSDWEEQLRELIRRFQNEPDADVAHKPWRRIEKIVFGVTFED
jgi:hypothetical protein